MNKTEALAVLGTEMARWRHVSWSELAERVGIAQTLEMRGASGTLYQVEVQVFWDERPDGVVRVTGSVDDGGLRAFVPLTDDFLVRPDGSFIDEDGT